MNRRNFFKAVTGFMAGVFATSAVAKEKPKLTKAKDLERWQFEVAPYDGRGNSDVWRFYINGKEINGNRATDEQGCLCWPFQGAKKGDLCTAKSPKVFV